MVQTRGVYAIIIIYGVAAGFSAGGFGGGGSGAVRVSVAVRTISVVFIFFKRF